MATRAADSMFVNANVLVYADLVSSPLTCESQPVELLHADLHLLHNGTQRALGHVSWMSRNRDRQIAGGQVVDGMPARANLDVARSPQLAQARDE